jgi:Tfp pilus assembly major pilin PilA
LNALATRFLWRNFLVLYADIVSALDERPGAVSFYIGHELGHIRRGHLVWAPVLAPGKMLPYLGFGYRRAQEYTCDLHGLACCGEPEDAQRALVVLAAGKRRWKGLNLAAYGQQLKETSGFWMSFHEIISDYPWLVKRVEHVTAVAAGRVYKPPMRNPLAWIPALFALRVGGSAILGLIVWVYVGMLAAIAIPAYQDFLARSQTVEAIQLAGAAEIPIAQYYADHNTLPTDLASIYPTAANSGVGRYTDTLTLLGPSGETLGILATMKSSGVTGQVAGKTVELWSTDNGATWQCGPGDTNPVDIKYLPASCREDGAP